MRKNAIRINELYEECKYILKNNIKTEDDLLEKQNALLAKEKQLMNRRSSLRSVEDKEMLRQYRALKKRLSDTPDWETDLKYIKRNKYVLETDTRRNVKSWRRKTAG